MEIKDESLVSVGVIAYNSSLTILDTLESIKNQDYLNLELIIADDASSDNTLKIVSEWIEKNNERFTRIKVLKNIKNKGTTQNIQKCLKECEGEYVKFIAADDILLPKNITVCLAKLKETAENILFAKMIGFTKVDNKIIKDKEKYECRELTYCKNAKEQYSYFLRLRGNIAPTLFFKTKFLKDIGGFDDKNYILLEDLPLLLKITKLGHKIVYLDEVTVMYRRHIGSVTTQIGRYVNVVLNNDLKKVFYEEIYPELKKGNIIDKLYLIDGVLNFYIRDKIIKSGNKKNSKYKYLKIFSIVSIYKYLKYIYQKYI